MADQDIKDNDKSNLIPAISLRDVVVFPSMVIPLFVGREKSIIALNKAMDSSKEIVLITQKKAEVDDPDINDLFKVGTLAKILQLLKLPDGTVKVLVEVLEKIDIKEIENLDCFYIEPKEISNENNVYPESQYYHILS